MRRATTRGIGLAALLLPLALVLLWQPTEPPDTAAPVALAPALPVPPTRDAAAPAPTVPLPAAGAAAAGHDRDRADLALMARWKTGSQRGSEPDGAIRFDAAGRLLYTIELRRRLDYFLALQGEFSLADIRRLLELSVAREHGSAAAAAVLAVFERYLGLQQATATLSAEGDLAARFAALQVLRRDWFGADASGLFGAEEAYTSYTLEHLALLRDTQLSVDERQARLAALAETRPLSERLADEHSLAAVLAADHERDLAEQSAPEAQRQAERAALWGDEAADRLAALDAERAAWESRLAQYRADRDRLLGDPRLGQAARDQALATLRQRGFSAEEQRRIASLEAIGALAGGG